MKKRKALCFALASLFACSALAGCSGGDKPASDTGNSSNSSVPDYDCSVAEDPNLASESSADLTFIRPNHDPDKAEDPINIAINAYKQQYNAKVDVQMSDYDTWKGKIIAAKNSGKSIDVIYGDAAYYPLFAAKQYTEPVDKYINLDDDSLFSRQGTEAFYKFKGQNYCAGFVDTSVYVLYYNKQIVSELGLKDPLEIYNSGNWNWDTFRDMCKTVTADTDGDGTTDRWGLATWYDYYFLGANHCSICNINNDGKFELNLDNPALTTALTFIKDAWYDSKWEGLDGDSIFDSWRASKNLFVAEYDYNELKDCVQAKEDGKFDFDYGVVPFPYGPDNTEKYNIGNDGGYGIGSGCSSPYHAAQLIKMMAKANHADVEAKQAQLPPDHVALYKEMGKKIYNNTYYDSAISTGNSLCDAAAGGKSVAQAISSIQSYYQDIIDDVNENND